MLSPKQRLAAFLALAAKDSATVAITYTPKTGKLAMVWSGLDISDEEAANLMESVAQQIRSQGRDFRH